MSELRTAHQQVNWVVAIGLAVMSVAAVPAIAETGRQVCAPIACSPCRPVHQIDPASFQLGFKSPRFLASRSTNFLATRNMHVLADRNPKFLVSRSTRVLVAPHQLAPIDRSISGTVCHVEPCEVAQDRASVVRGGSAGYAANRAPVFKIVHTGPLPQLKH